MQSNKKNTIFASHEKNNHYIMESCFGMNLAKLQLIIYFDF